MNNKFAPLLFLVLLFTVSPVFAQSCDPLGFMGTGEVGKNITLTQTCPTCNFINLTIRDPNLNVVRSNVDMILVGGVFEYEFDSTSLVGTYFVDGYSQLDEPFRSCFDVTSSGFAQDSLWFNFILLFLFVFGAFTLIYSFNETREVKNEKGLNSIYYFLGSTILFLVGVVVIIEGFGGYQTLLTDAFGYVTWGSGFFFMFKPWYVGGRWAW